MSQASNTTNELELLHEYLPDSFLNEIHFRVSEDQIITDLESLIDYSQLTAREYLAYVLAEVTDKTGKESAKLMKIEEGTYWGKLGRARDKMSSAEATLELKNPV